jgi:peptide deformylase
MVETMRNANGIGLAANQVGFLWRVITIEIPPAEEDEDENNGQLYRLINPSIVKRSGKREVEEGCLSIPGYRGFIERSLRVTVKALAPNSKEFRIKADELLAQALEHEIDHLNGILYTDHLTSHENLEQIETADPQSTTS